MTRMIEGGKNRGKKSLTEYTCDFYLKVRVMYCPPPKLLVPCSRFLPPSIALFCRGLQGLEALYPAAQPRDEPWPDLNAEVLQPGGGSGPSVPWRLFKSPPQLSDAAGALPTAGFNRPQVVTQLNTM